MKANKSLRSTRAIVLFIGSVVCLRGFSLSDLAVTTDAVVVGTVATRTEASTVVTFDLTVLRVLKGSQVPREIHVTHLWSGAIQGPIRLDAVVNGIWLLSKASSGAWDVIPCRGGNWFSSLFYPASVAAPNASFAYSSSTPLQDSLAFEVAAGLQTLGSPGDMLGAP